MSDRPSKVSTMNEIPQGDQFAKASTYDSRQLWDLGYRRLVPIIPPAVQLSQQSSLAKSQGLKSDPRGKSPGVRGPDGLWTGLKGWLNHKTTERDLKAWEAMEAGVGMRAGPIDPERPNENWLVFIDSDTYDADLAREVDKIVYEHFGFLPCRIGRSPKALYPIRVSSPVRYSRVMFGEVREKGLRKHAVEILAGMKQAVFSGIHPATSKPYYWPRKLVPLNALTIVAPEQLTAFMTDLAEKLPNATTAAREAARGPLDRAQIDQDALKAPIDLVEQAVAAIPNTIKDFPTYDDMTSIGYSIKGATQDDPDRGLDIFDRWVASWEGGDYEPSEVRKWWDSYKPPYQNGAKQLFREANKHSDVRFSTALTLFESLGDDETGPTPGTAETLCDEAASKPPARRQLRFIRADEAAKKALAAKARPLVQEILDCGAMSAIYGRPGAGKTFVMLTLGYCVASGQSFGGRSVTQGAVAYIAAEGGGRIFARVKALQDSLGAHDAEGLPVQFYLLPETVDLRNPDADLQPLLDALASLEKRAGRFALIVVDTLARSMGGGDENSPVDMGRMVAHLDRIRMATGAHVAVVHHSGKDAARGMRGHSSLLGAVDTELEVCEGVVTATKQRDLEDGASFCYRLRPVFGGMDDEGAPIKSAIAEIEPCEETAPHDDRRRLTTMESRILEICHEFEGSFSLRDVGDAIERAGQQFKKDSVRTILNKLHGLRRLEKESRNCWRICEQADSLSIADAETVA